MAMRPETLPGHQRQSAGADPGRASKADSHHQSEPTRDGSGSERVHPRRATVLPQRRAATPGQAGSLRHRTDGAVVDAQTQRFPDCMVACAGRETLDRQRSRALALPTPPSRPCEARPMNAEGKPYAGNPHVRFGEGPLARASCTAGWGLLNRLGCAPKWRLPSEMKGGHPEEDRVKQGAKAPAWHRE